MDPDTDELLREASGGDHAAMEQLLARHRDRLRRMVRLRIDARVAARIDPSDVVQEAISDAWRKLPGYLRHRPVPFYPWLRQLAWERLIDLHRRHIHAQIRTVKREEGRAMARPDESAAELANRLVTSGTSPSQQLEQREVRERVRAALAELPLRDHEVLVLRYLEKLATKEIAAVLSITEGAVKSRHRRALERLRDVMTDETAEEER